MRQRQKAMLAAAGAALFVSVSLADIVTPTIVKVFFQMDGEPYNKPVDFSVRCYGWRTHPTDPDFPSGGKPKHYTPKEVYSFSASCPNYGCPIHHNLYLNYIYIDYCNLEGKTEGRKFRIEKFGTSPVGKCDHESGEEKTCELRINLPR